MMISALIPFAALGLGAPDVEYARIIQPILAEHCVRCHGPKKQEGGLRLDVRRRALVGGDSGSGFVPGSTNGEVLRRIASNDDKERMPPSGKPLDAEQIANLRSWAEHGARWPDELAGKEPAEEHWAFQPVRRPAVPSVRGAYDNPIDAIVLSRSEALAPEAEARTLIRRLYLDLVGLPPPIAEVEEFLREYGAKSPAAYAVLVDRLLASPHFGERWGRHWLDLARFAESDGYENDNLRHDAWRFRDWVVAAINDDLPFDQFTIHQLAGDLLPNATNEQKIAAGFHRNTLWNSAASADKEEFRTHAVKDRTDTTGTAWMGLTLGCAQCHSHKYDPLAQREYYQLYAFFNRTDNADVLMPDGKSKAPSLRETARVTHVHKRGSFLQKGEEVTPTTPAFLPPIRARGKSPDRLDLARWLIDPTHPLTARVAVNHIWQHLFGVGLVTTPENFGVNGSPPAHPELLDFLASEFVRLRWSRKALVRLIVMSATYRQTSTMGSMPRAALGQNRFRVEAEIVRDLALSVSGLMSPKMGGPSIVPPFPEGLLEQKFTNESLKLPGPDRHRRGIYIHVQRTLQHPTLAVFDAADGNQPCARRDRSTTPLQALTMLNDPVFVECTRVLGVRLAKADGDDASKLRFGYELCFARPPSAKEQDVLMELLATQRRLGAKDEAVWLGVARTLLNLAEFITRD